MVVTSPLGAGRYQVRDAYGGGSVYEVSTSWTERYVPGGDLAMNMRAVSMRSTGPNRCIVELEREGGGMLLAEFTVVRDGGITSASADPDVFRYFDGTADEQRRIVATVALFYQVAEA